MADRAAQLQGQIAIYRQMLRDGTFSQDADGYLRWIIEAQEEIRQLNKAAALAMINEASRNLQQRIQALRSMAMRCSDHKEAQLLNDLADFYAKEAAELEKRGGDC